MYTSGTFTSIVIGQDLMASFGGPTGSEYELMTFESIALNITGTEAICILRK